MLQNSFNDLDAAEKMIISEIGVNPSLTQLVEKERDNVKDDLSRITPSTDATMVLEFAIIQQRLICLNDFLDFLVICQEIYTQQPATEN